MKVLAMYLPQFHRVAENDEWWGEGYTEWTAVKKGEKLFPGHDQPRVPMRHNYYDLLKKETMQWQTELMKKYNVYGMCFYHYYFQGGRKILEKPAENLLRWKDIDMPFCFSWANETWARTWSKLTGTNTWNSREEKVSETEDDGILLKQEYGGEKDWENHFHYLLPFFEDIRYIKVENKPVFIIYKPDEISCLPQMMEKWNQLAKEHGMDGIYFVGTNSERDGFQAYLRQETYCLDNSCSKFSADYSEICNGIIKKALFPDERCYLCGVVGYDDTPRRGRAGNVITNASPDQFYRLMCTLLYLAEQRKHKFIFVNAWNEWGEGMYLEPDERFGYGYLEALSKALDTYKDMVGSVKKELDEIAENLPQKKEPGDSSAVYRRNACFMRLFDKWLRIKEEGRQLNSYFKEKGYRNVAIYGIGMAGKHLLADLKGTGIKVVYGIDRQGKQLNYPFPVYTIEEQIPEADVVVVTVTYEFDSIYKELRARLGSRIVSLEEIVDFVDAMG